MNVKPRNNFVIVKIVDTGRIGSVLTPERAAEGKRYFIEAVGDKVTDGLKKGDRVYVIGNQQSLMFLPGNKEFFFTDQENVVLVYDESEK